MNTTEEQTKVIEGKRLIAEFMGGEFEKYDKNYFSFGKDGQIKIDSLLYDSNWNALMPVVEKIKEVTEEPEDIDSLKDVLWWGTIEDVFYEAIEIIERYNSQAGQK